MRPTTGSAPRPSAHSVPTEGALLRLPVNWPDKHWSGRLDSIRLRATRSGVTRQIFSHSICARRFDGTENVVGAAGFEPAAPCAQGRCATRLRYAPTTELSHALHELLESGRPYARDFEPRCPFGSTLVGNSYQISTSYPSGSSQNRYGSPGQNSPWLSTRPPAASTARSAWKDVSSRLLYGRTPDDRTPDTGHRITGLPDYRIPNTERLFSHRPCVLPRIYEQCLHHRTRAMIAALSGGTAWR